MKACYLCGMSNFLFALAASNFDIKVHLFATFIITLSSFKFKAYLVKKKILHDEITNFFCGRLLCSGNLKK